MQFILFSNRVFFERTQNLSLPSLSPPEGGGNPGGVRARVRTRARDLVMCYGVLV